jgi:membrane fusion protein (multidrug efflux system)
MKVNGKIVFALAIAASAVLASCGGKKQQQVPSATFKTTKVGRQDVTLETKYSATIRGRQDVDIYPQVGGTLKQICVTEGQAVRQGQTLFVIDQVPYQAALNTALAALKAAQASESTASMNYESKKKLFAENVISDFDLQTSYNTLMTARAQVAQAEAQVTNARNSLSYTVVTSPTNGVVGTLPYRQGALVSAQLPQPLTTVSDNAQMWVYFSISERDLLSIVRKNGSINEAVKNMPLDESHKARYTEAMNEILESLIDEYASADGDGNDGLLLHGTYYYAGRNGIDECCIWGDYFYLEALCRVLNPDFKKFW